MWCCDPQTTAPFPPACRSKTRRGGSLLDCGGERLLRLEELILELLEEVGPVPVDQKGLILKME